jgi:hypothetical protein
MYHWKSGGDVGFCKVDAVPFNIVSEGVARDDSRWSSRKGEIKADPRRKGISK